MSVSCNLLLGWGVSNNWLVQWHWEGVKDSSESPEGGRDVPCLARLGAAAGEMGKLGSVILYKGNYTVFQVFFK